MLSSPMKDFKSAGSRDAADRKYTQTVGMQSPFRGVCGNNKSRVSATTNERSHKKPVIKRRIDEIQKLLNG